MRDAATREERIDAARDAWAGTVVAEKVEEFVAGPAIDSSGSRHAGVIAASDFGGFRASWEAPIAGSVPRAYGAEGGAWSQGPAFLQALAILDGFGG